MKYDHIKRMITLTSENIMRLSLYNNYVVARSISRYTALESNQQF
jgi:hypothetical protein